MTDCERADLLIGLLEPGDTSADDALTPAERAEAQAHVRGCAACREALEAYRALSGALRALPPARDEAPTPEATARAYAAVVEAMGAANTAGGPGVRLLTGGGGHQGRVLPGPPGHPGREERRAWRRPAVWLQGLAAAACLLIVATLALRPGPDQALRTSQGPRASVEASADRADAPEPSAAPAAPAPPAPPSAPAAERRSAAEAHKTQGDSREARRGAPPSGGSPRPHAQADAPGPTPADGAFDRGALDEAAEALGAPAPVPPSPLPPGDALPAHPAESRPPSAPPRPSAPPADERLPDADLAREQVGAAPSGAAGGGPGGPGGPGGAGEANNTLGAAGADGAAGAAGADGAVTRRERAAEAVEPDEGAGVGGGDGADDEAVIVAAWRVAGRIVLLERTGGVVLAREGALLPVAERGRGAAAGEGEQQRPRAPAAPQRLGGAGGEGGAGGAGGEGGAGGAGGAAELEVTPVSPSDVSFAASTAEQGLHAHVTLARDLRAILAAELQGPRDARWSERVAALLRVLGAPAPAAAEAEELARRARRFLDARSGRAAPAGR